MGLAVVTKGTLLLPSGRLGSGAISPSFEPLHKYFSHQATDEWNVLSDCLSVQL